MRTEPPHYRAYLLRFWEERSQHPDGPVLWRFSLVDLHTGVRYGFGTLHPLVDFLAQQIGEMAENPADQLGSADPSYPNHP